jgi:AcrR family transcriptional regulator
MTSPAEPTDTTAPVVGDFPHGRVPRAVREQQVLGIAQSLFAERGYQGASMDELASRAGVSKPVVYDLVGSKDELFRRLMDKLATDLADAILEFARERGFRRIRGRLPEGNEPALSFLSSIGAMVPLRNPDMTFELPL